MSITKLCFDYLYLCSPVAINYTEFVLYFVSPPKSAFILFPVYVISFQLCSTFSPVPDISSTQNEKLSENLFSPFTKWMLYLYMIATHHYNIHKIKTSEDTWAAVLFLILVWVLMWMCVHTDTDTYCLKYVFMQHIKSVLPSVEQRSYFEMEEHAQQKVMGRTFLTQ